jgi:hypothetical protein
MSRAKTFADLPRPTRPGTYTVAPVGGACRVARSFEDHPAVLLAFGTPGRRSAPRRLAHLRYDPPRQLELARAGEVVEIERLGVLECLTDDPVLAAYFYRIVESVLLDHGDLLDEERFDSSLDAVATLFRSLQRPGATSVQGLWAELAMVYWSTDPVTMIAAWHSHPHQLHDFVVGVHRLEVKSTRRPTREHSFLLDQLLQHPDGLTVIASLMLSESEDGVDIDALVELVLRRLPPGAGPARRLETIVADSLGLAWRDASELRFGLDQARRSLRFFLAGDIPSVPQPLPATIKEVRFVADLSALIGLDPATLSERAALLATLLPTVVEADAGVVDVRDLG